MKKLRFIFLISLFIFVPASHSNGIIKDSVYTVYEIGNKIKNIDSLFILSSNYISVDNEIAMLYAEKGNQLLREISYKKGQLNYYLIKAKICYYDDRYNSSLEFLDSVKTLIDFEQDSPELAQYYHSNSAVEFCLGNFQRAIKNCLKAIDVYNSLGDFKGMSGEFSFMGNIYLEQKNNENAEKYLKKALKYNRKINDVAGYGNILINIGNLKEEQDSLLIAVKLYTEAYELFVEIGELRRIALSLLRIAKVQTVFENFNDALEKLNEAEKIYAGLEEKFGLTLVYNQMNETHRAANNYILAIDFGQKANNMAMQINSKPLIAKSYLKLSKVYKATGDFENALLNFEEYENLNTELISWQKNKQILNLEYKSELLASENALKISVQKNRVRNLQFYFLIAFGGIAILVTFGVIFFLRLKNNNLRQKQVILEEKNRLIAVENQMYEQTKIILENDLELKNKELASKALALIQLNETLKHIGTNINTLKTNDVRVDTRLLKKIMQDIHLATHNNIWKEFDIAFNKVHNSFYDKLLEICPNLSSTEIKIAALLKLNLSTKEIAAISFKSESAIKTGRHRLRNKIGLKPDESLIPFLLKL